MGQCQSVCTSKTAPGSPREKDDRGLEPSSSGAGGGKNPASVLNLGKEAEMYFAKGGKVWYQKVREGTRPRRRGRFFFFFASDATRRPPLPPPRARYRPRPQPRARSSNPLSRDHRPTTARPRPPPRSRVLAVPDDARGRRGRDGGGGGEAEHQIQRRRRAPRDLGAAGDPQLAQRVSGRRRRGDVPPAPVHRGRDAQPADGQRIASTRCGGDDDVAIRFQRRRRVHGKADVDAPGRAGRRPRVREVSHASAGRRPDARVRRGVLLRRERRARRVGPRAKRSRRRVRRHIVPVRRQGDAHPRRGEVPKREAEAVLGRERGRDV